MAASDLTSVSYVVKKLYSGQAPQNLASRDRVFLSKVKKQGGLTGSDLTVSLQYGNQAGVGAVFATAQAAASATKGVQWTLTRAKKYGVSTIDSEFIAATKDQPGSFVRGLKNEIDSMVDEVGHRLAMDLYGDGTGSIGRYSSTVTGTQIALATVDDVKHFVVGMYVVASANADGSAPRASSNATSINGAACQKVTAVDEDNGYVTLDALHTSLTANDYLFPVGDVNASLKGLAAWIPLSTPSATTFFGVDRTAQPALLAGWRVNATSNSIEENLITLGAKIQRAGGRPDAVFLNPTNFANLVKSEGTKVMRDQGGDAVMGFASVKLATPAGIVSIYPDPECPTNLGYMLTMKSWTLGYLGSGIPHIVMDDSLESLRQSTADGVEVRARYWGQLYCTAPGWNGVFAI